MLDVAWCRSQFPALERCRRCGGELRYEPLGGAGMIHSFIVQHHRVAPGFDAERPYAIALVVPDEAPGVRLPCRIVGADPHAVRIGARVEAEVTALPGGAQRVAVFRLTSSVP